MGQIPTIALKTHEEILKIDVKYSSRKNLIKYGDVIIDNKAKRAFCCDNEMHMTPKEYKILEFLANHPGEVFSREEIISSVWPEGASTSPRAIDVHVRKIRKALNAAKKCSLKIRTARSFGYSINMIE